jgi:Succinate dehydrogenase/Fumarate reductase transmembrane subunit
MQRLGTLYRGREGMWTWVLHRVSGVAILFYLFAHVADTALVNVSPEAYNRVIGTYRTPFVGVLEIGLAVIVIFHALRRHHQVHPLRGLHHLVPGLLGGRPVLRPGGDRERPPLHLRFARPGHRRAPRRAERQGGVWRCRTTFNCTDACPRGIKVTQAIQELKRALLFRKS